MSVLIVTNGESGVQSIRRAGIEGDIFSWDDVLHDGPVPGGYDLKTLSELRARYIHSLGWGKFENIHQKFKTRDEKLMLSNQYDELVLFFEHDLYDQLQLIQILSLFSSELKYPDLISIAYPPDFIGYCSDEQLQKAFNERKNATQGSIEAATTGWHAFTGESPETLVAELAKDEATLPYLQLAMKRLVEEFPDKATELSRTEYQILEILSQEGLTGGTLFQKVEKEEEAAFMGDWSFMVYLTALTKGSYPLVRMTDTRQAENGRAAEFDPLREGYYEITPAGQSILDGEAKKSQFIEIDRWIGGTYVTTVNFWQWDAENEQFVFGG